MHRTGLVFWPLKMYSMFMHFINTIMVRLAGYYDPAFCICNLAIPLFVNFTRFSTLGRYIVVFQKSQTLKNKSRQKKKLV